MADTRAWRLRTRSLPLDRPILMGVVNVTPDSFSDGGLHATTAAAIDHGRRLVAAGADIVDVGGESTRPGANPVSADVERSRAIPVVEALASEGIVASIDTTKPEIARAAVEAGAEIINDITAGRGEGMAEVMATSGAGVVLMHMQGTPRTMQDDPRYEDVVAEVKEFLVTRATTLGEVGVAPLGVAIDPGIGFGKTVAHNLELIRRIGELVATGYPVIVGASRKGFLGSITGVELAADRDTATAAVTALVVAAGVAGVRIHDVEASRRAAEVAWAVARSRG
ncbi:MAG: dihydropteroate synthase [Acidimicrobiia bacterium]